MHPKRSATGKFAVLMMAPLLLVALSSCSKGVKGTETSSVTQTPTGAVAVETFTTSATVTAIDGPKRKVTLTTPDGSSTTYKAGPDVVNFDQLQVGDQVKATVTEEVAVQLEKNGPPPSASGRAMVALSPVGGTPGGLMTATVQASANVTAVDTSKRKVTLLFPDGKSKTYKVDKDIDLTKVQPGDDVVVTVTEGIAISVVKS